ncbi:MAG: bifunctional glutamate N-acetyltransferase/amino-acid acetyltransferase ArgJ [Microthrixaceae bacterium]|nr:bifunctional glutamate N-acetyltransferase/amino-acid acetyltransferase ArgJ [Microthrixaceae bacterium]MCB1010162.1 bifunctional glutamate N-acetyltransferase/amino-acid acetyltransferase ArgJ [Microthrixaceae bacterium]MCB9387139.1 bifunctional glutamate N-acetyltransferase/amino-acid acetyltransferase ArgJ [Microthrixaceae bacterium]
MPLPGGFHAHVANVGIKDTSLDFAIIAADRPCRSAAVFTRSRFSGPSVVVSRQHAADGVLQAIVVVSKNANVATGAVGTANAQELTERVGEIAGCPAGDVLVASTGVIGRPYPMDRIRAHLDALSQPLGEQDAVAVATAMMTTDTHPKVASAKVTTDSGQTANIVGIAKGVGMIEPDMATMLAFVLTDAEVPLMDLRSGFHDVVDRSFNSLSIDTDTSTSDTAAVMASGVAGEVDAHDFMVALQAVCTDLTRQLAIDGEGATKLLEVEVTGARDDDQAKRVAKAVVNSPLVKTAVHGADPNWGRVAMAVGKCSDDSDIEPARTRISFGGTEVYPTGGDSPDLAELEKYLAGDEVHIGVDLGISAGHWIVYGCDLSDGYVRINADYTT